MKASAGATRKWRGAVLGVAVATGLAGCGGGGDSKLAVGEPKSEAAEYCAKSLEIETFPEPDIDFETATPEQLAAALKSYAGQLLPLAQEAGGVSPAEIKPDLDVLIGAVRSVALTGDFSTFESDPTVNAAEDKVHAFELDNCGWGNAEVSGTEYSFDGIPKEIEAGPVNFELSNEGKEAHHLVLFRINDGVDLSVDELLALPEEEADTKAEAVAGMDEVDPGDNDYVVANLTAGRYAVVCFLPVGGGEEGAPHFTRGMTGEFKVS